ncbi:MAG: cell division protein FtsZ, partial [Alphaproteobacteria bacterium]|nr:cell division protein FtsZ [Alphaproteobacteria bacterium]
MTINFSVPHDENELKPRITVVGVGGAGGNAVNNMIRSNLEGVEFIVTNTDSQSLSQSLADRRLQLGPTVTQGLGAGSRPDVGKAAAEEAMEALITELGDSNMVFITAGMGGGTGTGAAPVIAQAARERGILTVGVITKPFHFEGGHRMRTAEAGIEELSQYVDTLIIIPNQNLFRIANEKTTFADAFHMADNVLHQGVRGVTDLMVMPGLINLDFADIRTVMSEMGKAMMGTGEASGEKRAIEAAESAISNPLLDDMSMKGARGVLINITGGMDMTLFEVDEAANRIREEVDADANIIFGSTFDEKLDGMMRVSVVSTGIAAEGLAAKPRPQMTLVSSQPTQTLAPEVAPAPETAIMSGMKEPEAELVLRTGTDDAPISAEAMVKSLNLAERKPLATMDVGRRMV